MKGLLNLQNNDNECARWCHVRLINSDVNAHTERITKKDKIIAKQLNYDGIEFPVTVKRYNKVEKQNDIRVNVFGYENKQNVPIHISKEKFENLLLIKQSDKEHYVLIKDFNRFMRNQTKHNERKHFCMYCLQCFTSEAASLSVVLRS